MAKSFTVLQVWRPYFCKDHHHSLPCWVVNHYNPFFILKIERWGLCLLELGAKIVLNKNNLLWFQGSGCAWNSYPGVYAKVRSSISQHGANHHLCNLEVCLIMQVSRFLLRAAKQTASSTYWCGWQAFNLYLIIIDERENHKYLVKLEYNRKMFTSASTVGLFSDKFWLFDLKLKFEA